MKKGDIFLAIGFVVSVLATVGSVKMGLPAEAATTFMTLAVGFGGAMMGKKIPSDV